MRSSAITRITAGGAVALLSIWASASGALATPSEDERDAGSSAEHRNDAVAHEEHGPAQESSEPSAEATATDESAAAATDEPQPASNADFSGNGANEHGAYDST